MALNLQFRGLTPFGNTGIVIPSGGSGSKNDTTSSLILMPFQATLSGSYVQHGDPCDFTVPALVFPFGEWAPYRVEVQELGSIGAALTNFKFDYVWGPTLAAPTMQGGAIQISGTGTGSQDGGNEIAAGLYSGMTPSLNGVQLAIDAYFVKS